MCDRDGELHLTSCNRSSCYSGPPGSRHRSRAHPQNGRDEWTTIKVNTARGDLQMTTEDFLGIVTHTILDGQQRYIALCTAAPQEVPAKEKLLQTANSTVETIVRAAGEVPAADRAEALTKAAAIIVNLSFARIGSVLESQFSAAERRGRCPF
jgi:hypothetical protein